MAKIVTLNIGASRAMLAEYVLKGKKGLVLSAYGAADLAGLDWEAEGSVEAVLAPALREAAKAAGRRNSSIQGDAKEKVYTRDLFARD